MPAPPAARRRFFGGILLDTRPLRRHRDFRRLWGGQLVSQFGSQLTIVAVAYQTYRITSSTLMAGLVSLGQRGMPVRETPPRPRVTPLRPPPIRHTERSGAAGHDVRG
jgi:hypothetical protein